MRFAILLTILAAVTLSLAEENDASKNANNETTVETNKDTDANKEDVGKEQNTSKGSEEKYTDRFDNINVDELIANRRLLVPYLKCVLNKGRCTPEGKELKVHVEDAMKTACKKCTDKQKEGARKVVNHIKDNEPIYWDELVAMFDPKGEFKNIYLPFLAGKDPQ